MKGNTGLPVIPEPLERHYSPKEIAQAWLLDQSTVRRIFQDEPGVMRIGKSRRRDGKRDYVTIRIPHSVMCRVHRERIGVK